MLAFALACPVVALASSGDDPLLDDATVIEHTRWHWLGELLLRSDRVQNLAGREPISRVRSRGRVGGAYALGALELGLALEGALGSDDNDDNRRNNDNEASDGAVLDTLFARWRAGESTTVQLGKAPLPLSLTPLTWDQDLRPIGASVSHDIALGDFDRLGIVAGWYAPDHLYGDDSRLAAAQLGWHIREGAPVSGEVLLSYLVYDDLETLVREGLARANRRVAGRLANDYELLDLQLGLVWRAGEVPVVARLDLVRNLGADTQRDGFRASLVLGSTADAGDWEFGLAAQRAQREAVMAAFSADDWWFHSFARGVMPWVGYAIDDTWRVQVAGIFERRDDQQERVVRSLLDVRATW